MLKELIPAESGIEDRRRVICICGFVEEPFVDERFRRLFGWIPMLCNEDIAHVEYLVYEQGIILCVQSFFEADVNENLTVIVLFLQILQKPCQDLPVCDFLFAVSCEGKVGIVPDIDKNLCVVHWLMAGFPELDEAFEKSQEGRASPKRERLIVEKVDETDQDNGCDERNYPVPVAFGPSHFPSLFQS